MVPIIWLYMTVVVVIIIIIIIIIIIHDDDCDFGYYDCCCLPSVVTCQPVILQAVAGSSHTVVRCL
jgi:hypothetical protein